MIASSHPGRARARPGFLLPFFAIVFCRPPLRDRAVRAVFVVSTPALAGMAKLYNSAPYNLVEDDINYIVITGAHGIDAMYNIALDVVQ